MANYPTDQEQVELIKTWWGEYGRWILVAVVVGLALGWVIHYWRQHQEQDLEQAAQIYQQMLVFDLENNPASTLQLGQRLSHDYAKTIYADFANLLLAKQSAANQRWDEALTRLQVVIDHGQLNSFKQIARLRAARILLQQKQWTAALTLLKTVNDPVYQPLIDAIRGDILLAEGQTPAAHAAYQAAQQALSAAGFPADPILSLKLAQPSGE